MKDNLLRFTEYFNQQMFATVEDVALGLDVKMIPSDVLGKDNATNRVDTLNRPTSVGDVVSYCQRNEFRFGILIGYTPEGFRVLDFSRRDLFSMNYNHWSSYSKAPQILVVQKVTK